MPAQQATPAVAPAPPRPRPSEHRISSPSAAAGRGAGRPRVELAVHRLVSPLERSLVDVVLVVEIDRKVIESVPLLVGPACCIRGPRGDGLVDEGHPGRELCGEGAAVRQEERWPQPATEAIRRCGAPSPVGEMSGTPSDERRRPAPRWPEVRARPRDPGSRPSRRCSAPARRARSASRASRALWPRAPIHCSLSASS